MQNNHINYIELKCSDIQRTKDFYAKAFSWSFVDYGETYIAIEGAGIDGGFELTKDEIVNGALVVLYHSNLELCLTNVESAGGKISTDIFSFPGGRRFHFIDPSGNELAVWSDK